MLLMLLACGPDPELVAERDELAAKVQALEGELLQAEQERDAYKSRVESLSETLESQRRRETLARLGLEDGQSLKARLDTSMGSIHCTLWPDQAPLTVLNFVELAEGQRSWTDPRTGVETDRPLYDGTVFHRVIPRFMIQGGDPLANGMGGPGYQFEDEIVPGLEFDRPGLMAMANAGPNTNGSQFFVTEAAQPSLNGKHTIFGVCDEVDTVKAIARVERDDRDKPVKAVRLDRVRITRE